MKKITAKDISRITFPVATFILLCFSYYVINETPITMNTFNFTAIFAILVPVQIVALISLVFPPNEFRKTFALTSVYVLIASLLILAAPLNDINSRGMFGYEKDTMALAFSGAYSLVVFFSLFQSLFQKFLARKW